MNGLSKEQDAYNLENSHPRDARCSVCGKIIVSKIKLSIEKSLSDIIYNNKWFFFARENFKSARKESCTSNDNANAGNLRTRRSCRNE